VTITLELVSSTVFITSTVIELFDAADRHCHVTSPLLGSVSAEHHGRLPRSPPMGSSAFIFAPTSLMFPGGDAAGGWGWRSQPLTLRKVVSPGLLPTAGLPVLA